MKTLLACALAGAALFATGSASAATSCPKALQLTSLDTAVIQWQKDRVDSPLDPNTSRLAVHVLHNDGDDIAIAYNDCTGIEGKSLGQVRNLSFDFLNESSQPVTVIPFMHIHVGLDTNSDGIVDNSVALVASNCAAVLSEDARWSRADFTGRTSPGCKLFTAFDPITPAGMSDGVNSAWKNFAMLHPTWKVMTATFVLGRNGTAFIDRLAFHNRMFVQAGSGTSAVKNCPFEWSC
jgi:hypothetical protein